MMSDRSKWFAEQTEKIIEAFPRIEREISCKEVLELCRPYMRELCAEEPEDWLEYVYSRCLAQYFPENFEYQGLSRWEMAADLYLNVLERLFEKERKALDFDRCRDFSYLTGEEEKTCLIREEYDRFVESFKALHMYAFFRIAREYTPFDTLGHVAGVHNVAMYMGRQLVHTDIPVDLGLVSATAILHDIGKFGCRQKEMRRVPYLHYYYTDIFSKRFHFPVIGHIAANHSTWDLEFENLSLENLLLIYADFRVKSTRVNGAEAVQFYSLKESYDVILSKLDNVDDAKRERYRRVYSKLKDFEDFMIRCGISTDLKAPFHPVKKKTEYALMNREEQLCRYKDMAIDSNIRVMNMMNYDARFTDFLEEIRSEKDWRNVRAYLNVLEEYSTYMTQRQKDLVLDYLNEMQTHREGDIRRQAATIIGKLIARYETVYRKELPEGAKIPEMGRSRQTVWAEQLDRMLVPDHKLSDRESRWVGYTMQTVFSTVMDRISKEEQIKFLEVLLTYYEREDKDEVRRFILMNTASIIWLSSCNEQAVKVLYSFAEKCLASENEEIRASALQFFLGWLRQGWLPSEDQQAFEPLMEELFAEHLPFRYLKAGILARLRGETMNPIFEDITIPDIAELFQVNQKTDTPWVVKLTNLEILKTFCLANPDILFQFGAHLLNMLKTSDRTVVRLETGRILTEIIPFMTVAERYEIAVELVRGLEIGEDSVSKYIPKYLGEIFFYLPEAAQEEVLSRFYEMISGKNEHLAIVALETIGCICQYVFEHIRKTPENEAALLAQKQKLEGLMLRGMAHYLDSVSQEAFYNIGHGIFGSTILSLEEKEGFFRSMGRKVLTLYRKVNGDVAGYDSAAAFNHLYRFISDYLFRFGSIEEEKKRPVAFFPGTFDPFSQGHKEIVRQILTLGYELYLALDEFSWSKRTQPYIVRKRILQMSIADLENTYLFPTTIPVNIANPADMAKLRKCFAGKDLSLVMGSDVVANASAYVKEAGPDTVHSFDHIVFYRKVQENDGTGILEKVTAKVRGKVTWLELPEDYQQISSTRIRNNLDINQDITNLVDKNVQNYLYDRNLYTREPDYKKVLDDRPLLFLKGDHIGREMAEELSRGILKGTKWEGSNAIYQQQYIAIRNHKEGDAITGVILYHRIALSELWTECENQQLVNWMRERVAGTVIVIAGLYGVKGSGSRQTVLAEMLAHSLGWEYTYAVCFDSECEDNAGLLERAGFIPMEHCESGWLVDLRNPLVLYYDKDMGLKESFERNENVKAVVKENHESLCRALTGLYPGNLVLSLESDVLQHHLIKEITTENNVPVLPQRVRTLGSKMCVPFGKILKGVQIPNTVTKTLRTERYLSPDMETLQIREMPGYAKLRTQIRTIHSFDRPVILVDDYYHKGHRMAKINPYLKDEQVEVARIIVGVMTGNGRDLTRLRSRSFKWVYFIPNMRTWLTESDFYPFIGGDSVLNMDRADKEYSILPSVNPILPYRIPFFMHGTSMEDFYHISEVCLKNAKTLWKTLEQEFRREFHRKLTISQLSEVLNQPRVPDVAIGNNYDEWEAPSVYIQYEIDRLKRLKFGVKNINYTVFETDES